MNSTEQLTSTTAPGKVFADRSSLAEHYKSDWHKYNLKRREAGLPALLESDFEARLEAALALRKDKTIGKDHLKNKKDNKKHFKKNQKKKDGMATQVSQVAAYDRIKHEDDVHDQDEKTGAAVEETDEAVGEAQPTKEQLEAEAAIEIDPRQCLFDRHMAASVQANVERMQRKYGFYIPDAEYLSDLTGLIGYCHEKIKLGHMCLYCQKVFTTWQGCQKHMISKRHSKLRYEPGIDLEEFTVFYDFEEADADYLGRHQRETKDISTSEMDVVAEDDDDEGDGWEDISDDEGEAGNLEDAVDDEQDHDVEMTDDFDEAVARMGFDTTPLGELVLPDGRIIGHRAYRRYYKQRAPRSDNTNEAVSAARLAASERLYRGRVYRIGYDGPNTDADTVTASKDLIKAGIAPGTVAGRAGKGLLVGNGSSFTAMSIYRYQAALRKKQKGELQGQKLYNKTKQNINRMDKKHNRLMNGVSVAHAAR